MCLLVCDKCYLCFLLRNQVTLRGLLSRPAPRCEELSAALSGAARSEALCWVIFYFKQQLHCAIPYSCSLRKRQQNYTMLSISPEALRKWILSAVTQCLGMVSCATSRVTVWETGCLQSVPPCNYTIWKKLKTRQEQMIFHQTNLIF